MNNPNKVNDFISSWNSDIKLQKEIFATELEEKLSGVNYIRERDLGKLLPDIKVRPMKSINAQIGDIGFSIWVIAELRGRIAAQIAHNDLHRQFPECGNYTLNNRELHIALIGALNAETKQLLNNVKQVETSEEGDVDTKISSIRRA